jgi:hypothetical protein
VGASRNRRARLGRGAVIALSLMAHATVLSILGVHAPKLIFPTVPPAPLDVWLTPRLTPEARQAQSPDAAVRAGRPRSGAQAEIKRPATSASSSIPAGSPAIGSPAPVQGGVGAPSGEPGVGTGTQGALRAGIGCDLAYTVHLTAEERDRCNQHLAEEAKRGPSYIDAIPPEKRAYYDAVQAAYQAARDPAAPLYKDANGNIRSWGGPPAAGCAFRRHYRPGATLSDKIKATGMIGVPIGPLSCGLKLPQGSMTPELGIPTP